MMIDDITLSARVGLWKFLPNQDFIHTNWILLWNHLLRSDMSSETVLKWDAGDLINQQPTTFNVCNPIPVPEAIDSFYI